MSAAAIHVRDDGLFTLTTDSSSYAFGLDERGLLRHAHWGARVSDPADFELPALWDPSSNDDVAGTAALEYPVHGGLRFTQTGLSVRTSEGLRQLRLHKTGHELVGDTLRVGLADPEAGVEVVLHYRVLEDLDLLQRWVVVRNSGAGAITVENLASAAFHIPFEGLTLVNVHGMWAAEQQQFAQPMGFGTVVLESRRGISSHNHNPYFVLHRSASETAGEVWFGALEFGGNFRCSVEQPPVGGTQVVIGVNEWDLRVPLGPGESLTSPRVVAGYTCNGLAAVSERMHRYGRSLMRGGIRPVLYNSWEATGFDVTASGQAELARRAAEIGAELFVVDDGWFGRRDSASDGLGDWDPNPRKFPAGLAELSDEVHGLGMSFGIWVEPEMVNPASDLYRQHPDWVYRDPDREPVLAREQLVLNLCLAEVQDFVVATLARLLDSCRIEYVKWDANRPMAEVGERGDVWIRHTEALYDVVRRVRGRHPEVLIEACASGGGRIDFGTLAVFDDFWTSDNTDARDRLQMQSAYSLVYPLKAMRAWVTDSPNFLTQRPIPLEFRFRVAMMGSLGIGSDLTALSQEELSQYAAHIAEYKQIRGTIQEGDFHRLEVDTPGYMAFQYATGSHSVLFVFLTATQVGRGAARVRLRGLDPAARYRFKHDWRWQTKTGAYLMAHGLKVWLLGDYVSAVIEFEASTEDVR